MRKAETAGTFRRFNGDAQRMTASGLNLLRHSARQAMPYIRGGGPVGSVSLLQRRRAVRVYTSPFSCFGWPQTVLSQSRRSRFMFLIRFGLP